MERTELENLKKWCVKQSRNQADVAGYYFKFGKYKDLHVVDVLDFDPQYLMWAFESKKKLNLSMQITQFIRSHGQLIAKQVEEIDNQDKNVFALPDQDDVADA